MGVVVKVGVFVKGVGVQLEVGHWLVLGFWWQLACSLAPCRQARSDRNVGVDEGAGVGVVVGLGAKPKVGVEVGLGTAVNVGVETLCKMMSPIFSFNPLEGI